MKKLLLSLTLTGLLALALGGATSAQPPTLASLAPTWTALADPIVPTVSAIDPASAPNDIDTPVTITGTDFTAVMDGTGTVVVTSPTASLGSTALTDVTWVNSTTLTATVPWGMDPGVYSLTVVNPDGGTATLASAFTVTQGIGQWNGGDLFGGEVRQILMKPGDPNTLYAPADGIAGLFRSQDAGEHWTYVSADVYINFGKFAVDPHNPDWLYGFDYKGLHRSQDEGVTWTKLMPNTWPDGRSLNFPQVYVSPHDPQVLFISSSQKYGDPYPGDAFGLIKSTDGGTSWQIVADMEGLAVQDVAFDPTDLSQKMVLATSDARVFQSSDSGDTWSEVKKPSLSSLGNTGVITYNPDRPTEVWIASSSYPGEIYKSTDAALTSWQDVTPTDGGGSSFVTFTSADSVYTSRHHSTDGGLNWQWFGPTTANGEISFDPANLQIGYIGDGTYGVQKTTDGGQTWKIKSQGLAGMVCYSLEVSRADPLRVFATFISWPGIYRSNDGANNWTYLPIAGSGTVRQVREDPFNPQRLYVAADSGFYVSTDVGEHWSDLGWNTSPSLPTGMPWAMAADPYHPGHLLVGLRTSPGTAPLIAGGGLLSSSDYGVSWQLVTMPQDLAWISSIAFDPETPGLVYLATGGTGVYRSTNSGANWDRIDDLQQPYMEYANKIAIATHPRQVLFVATDQGPYRSFDGGATWEKAQEGGYPTFVDGDSTRLYGAGGTGLSLSTNAGDTWTQAAGVLGTLQIQALGYADADGHTILYAATSGGAAGTTSSTAAATPQTSPTTASTIRYAATSGGDPGATTGTAAETPRTSLTTASGLVDAGIYRYVLLPPRTLAVVSAGGGTGTVTSNPAGINCGSTCSHAFAYGSSVSLSVSPQAGSSFAGWSGACSGTGSCSLTMDADRSVTATFALQTRTLSVTKSGSGSGTVTSSPAGINCGSTCSHAFAYGSSVGLSASPRAGSTFAGFSGACSGRSSCMLTMSGNHSVKATFNLKTTKKPPQTKITKAKINSGKRTATFKFVGSGGSKPYSFQCKLDKTRYSSCRSGKTYKTLKPGKHTFWVRAKDHAGRVDKTPAIKKFKIKH